MKQIAIYTLTIAGSIPDTESPVEQGEAASSEEVCDQIAEAVRAEFARFDAEEPDDLFSVEFEEYLVITDDEDEAEEIRQANIDSLVDALIESWESGVR